MKLVSAYIKPHKLAEVILALREIDGLPGLSIEDGRGFGARGSRSRHPDFNQAVTDFVPHVKLEIICPEAIVDIIVRTIRETAATGLRGDGLVYVSPIERAERISE